MGDIVRSIDPNAFVIVGDAGEISGEGFREHAPSDLTLADLAALAPLLGCESLDIRGAHVPFDGTYAAETISGMMVLTPDLSANRSQLRRFLESE